MPWPSMLERISPASRSPSRIGVPGLRPRTLETHRHQALAHQAAILHARGQLLADEAALLEIDAVQLLEAALQQGRALDHQVAAAVGHAEREARVLVDLARRAGARPSCRERRPSRSGGSTHPRAEAGKARVDAARGRPPARGTRRAGPADRSARGDVRRRARRRPRSARCASSISTLARSRYIISRCTSAASRSRSVSSSRASPGCRITKSNRNLPCGVSRAP